MLIKLAKTVLRIYFIHKKQYQSQVSDVKANQNRSQTSERTTFADTAKRKEEIVEKKRRKEEIVVEQACSKYKK